METNNANHLADVHAGKVETPAEKTKVELVAETDNSNFLSQVHSGEVEVPVESGKKNTNHYENGGKDASDEQLSETPEVLPTSLGGIELETEPEEETSQPQDQSEQH